jgi:hypothetical protein
MKLRILTFLILVLTSPWLVILVYNSSIIKFPPFLNLDSQTVEINNARGLAQKQGLNFAGKIFMNKATFTLNNYLYRYFESFDFKYLFLEGDIDLTKSTKQVGIFYLGLLPLISLGLYKFVKQKNGVLLILLLLSPIPSIFISPHYDSISRILLFLVLTFIASQGFVLLINKKRTLALIVALLLLFEMTKFIHDLSYHYPSRLAKEGIVSIYK